MVALAEVLEREDLKGVIRGERRADAVRSVDRLAEHCALEKIHLAGALLQPLGPADVQEEPGRIGHDDQAFGLLGHVPESHREHVRKRAERMLEPALPHLRRVRLDRGRQFGRIEVRGKRTPPRFDDRRSQSCRRLRRKLQAESALGE